MSYRIQYSNGGYTAWVENFPQAVSQGESYQQAGQNLVLTLGIIYSYCFIN